jgi:hypothetical protein
MSEVLHGRLVSGKKPPFGGPLAGVIPGVRRIGTEGLTANAETLYGL